MKPAEMADKDENGEKGDPMYEEVVFGTTEMPIESKERLERIFDDTKILEAWPVGTTTPSTEASIQITVEPPSSLPYRRNEGDREVIRTLVQDLIDKRRVQESTSPYASPVHLVKKGTKFRLTIDYRKLNEVIVRQVWPMPLIDDLLTSFHGAKYFTTIDLEAAFYQIGLKKESRELTAFITQDGLYEFNVLPLGLGNSPAVMTDGHCTQRNGKICERIYG